jgi:serine/threonine protein kinase
MTCCGMMTCELTHWLVIDNKTGEVYMVFEYCDHDLTGLLESNHGHDISDAQVKYYMKSILEGGSLHSSRCKSMHYHACSLMCVRLCLCQQIGLHYIHKNNILHRDIKGANVLICNNGDLRLADFGIGFESSILITILLLPNCLSIWCICMI